MTDYEAVIGLETHIQLNTNTKIFCSCKADSWIDPPNTNICPVCCGLPGVLPMLNKAVVEKGVLLAYAMHGDIRPLSFFDRKNYFYPDLPKGYQISQFDQSLSKGGFFDLPIPASASADNQPISAGSQSGNCTSKRTPEKPRLPTTGVLSISTAAACRWWKW